MRFAIVLFLQLLTTISYEQTHLKPGFNGKEYLALLSLTFHSSSIPDSIERLKETDPYKLIYRSREMGFLNRFSLFRRNDNVCVIDVRGTVNVLSSWVGNFYAAMVPATGDLQLNDSTHFIYQLAENLRARVHVGWLVALGHLAPDIISKINEEYKIRGTKEFILFGHSQGAGITFLLRSYLEYERKKGSIPSDIILKTYCSAAPKPGNMYYAYDFDFITRNGWAYSIVNAADWVPETPFSIQTPGDFNTTNPFVNARAVLKKQKFLVRLAGTSIYNKMDRSTRKAQRRFTRYLGTMLYKQSKKTIAQLKEPEYSNTDNYMRAGAPVVLMPDPEYWKLFPDSKENVFIHHLFKPYFYLATRYYGKPEENK